MRNGTSALLKGTAAVLVGTVGATLIGLVRNKLLAVYVGSAGVGTLSVLVGVGQGAVAAVGILSGAGLVKYVSEYRAAGEEGLVRRVVESAMLLQVAIGLAAASAGVAAVGVLAGWLDLRGEFPLWYLAAVLGIAPIGLVTALQLAVLKGYKAMGALALVNVLSAALTVAMLFPMVRRFGTAGAVANLVIEGVVLVVVGGFFLRRAVPGVRLFALRPPDFGLLRGVVALGGVAQLSAVAVTWSTLYPRVEIARVSGLEAAGIYQAGLALLSYAMVIRSSLATYFFSEISERAALDDTNERINGTVRVSLLLTTPAVCLLLLFLPVVIRLLLSPEFLPVTTIALPLFLAVWVSSQGAFVGQALLGQGKVKESLLVELSWCGIFLGLNAVLIARWGLMGAAMAYTGSFMIGYPITVALAWRSIGYRPKLANVGLALSALALIVLSGSVEPVWLRWAMVPAVFLWFTISLGASARRTLIAAAVRRAPGLMGASRR